MSGPQRVLFFVAMAALMLALLKLAEGVPAVFPCFGDCAP